MNDSSKRLKIIGKIVRVASGNFLEMYDFIVYGYYARYIANTFFPVENAFASLMLSFATFGAGYFMRPLGALFLGAYIDKQGRRTGLMLTLFLMALGTFSIAVTPGYKVIGIAAPLMVLGGRLLQGLSAGVELGGVSVYLSEIATAGHRAFYTSWQSASQQIAAVFTALVGILLTLNLSEVQMSAWGWRLPFVIGCAIIPVLLWLRSSLEETEVFKKSKKSRSMNELFLQALANWRLILRGFFLSLFTSITFYLITAYTPTFGREALHLGTTGTFVVTLLVGISNFVWVPVGGAIADKVGGLKPLILMPVLCILTAYPTMSWLVHAASLQRLLVVELWYSFFFGIYNGAMIPFVIESLPQEIRTIGFSLAFSMAATFGGFTPALATFLIHETGNRAAPTVLLCLAALLSLMAALTNKGERPLRVVDFQVSSLP